MQQWRLWASLVQPLKPIRAVLDEAVNLKILIDSADFIVSNLAYMCMNITPRYKDILIYMPVLIYCIINGFIH